MSTLIFLLFPQIVFANWPMPGYDFNKSNAVPYQISEKPQEKWVTENITSIRSPLVTDSGGNIYLGTSYGSLTSLDKNGRKRWTTYPGIPNYPPANSPVIDANDNIYYTASSYPSRVYSVDQNGNKRWEYAANTSPGVALSRDKNTLYVGAAAPEQALVALNLDGSVKWRTNLNYNSPSSNPLVAPDGTIYVGTSTHYMLFALSDTGIIKWYKYVGSYDVISPILDSANNIYVRSSSGNNGIIVSYDPQGNRRWIYYHPTNDYGGKEMAIKNNIIYAVYKNNLIAIDTSGNLIWTWTIPYVAPQGLSSPVVDKDGNIYTSYGNKLYVLNSDGTLKWEIPLSGYLGKPIIADNDLIYIDHRISGTSEGYVHALGKITPVKTPVIFIPGIGGSELKVKNDVIWSKDDGHGGVYNHAYPAGEKVWVNEGEGILPGDDDYFDILRLKNDGQTQEADLELTGNIYSGSYQGAINFLVSAGYTLNQDLFVFPYDWRKDVSLTASFLDQKIENIKTQTGAQKVDIVAHSLGGLIARNYIADSTKASKVRKLITLGTPHLGAVEFLKDLRYGGCLSKVNLEPFCIGINPSEVKDVLQNYISGFELAPSQKYYDFYNGSDNNHPLPFVDNRDLDNNQVIGYLNYPQLKTLLTNLGHNTSLFTPTETFHALDNNLINTNGVDVNIIAGSGEATMGQIIEDYYLNFTGIKIPKTDMRNINGDGTVPLYSSSLVDGSKSLLGSAKVFYANQKHPDLVFDGSAMNLVKNILNGDSNLPAGISTTPFQFTGTGLSVHSPVLINAYDANSNHTGPLANGDYEVNIPGSSYEVIGDAKFIWLPDNGVYTLKFEATDQGSFDFKIRDYENDINHKTILYKDVPLTASTKAEATFDTNSSIPPTLHVDQDGNSTTDFNIERFSILEGNANYDYTSPKISFDVSPKTIWPPNNKMVNVNVTGIISDQNPYQTTIKVEDEYGLVEPSVTITNQTNINQVIKLEASRKGDDQGGRKYTIKILATDLAGNTSLAISEVVVPHDQGKK